MVFRPDRLSPALSPALSPTLSPTDDAGQSCHPPDGIYLSELAITAGGTVIYGFERVVGNLATGEVNVQLVFPDQEHMRRMLDLCRQKAQADRQKI